jgi:glycosyltransferase involved in cell wall biosynthesis
MIGTVIRVIRGEGMASALRRAEERVAEGFENLTTRSSSDAAILNFAPGGTGARAGGVAVQLRARLRKERALRAVAVSDSLPDGDARAIHLEGTSGVPMAAVLRLIAGGVPVVVSVHDFSLFCPLTELLEQPIDRIRPDSQRFDLARRLLESARGVIFPSRFLLEKHRGLFSLPNLAGEVIEPGSVAPAIRHQAGAAHRGIAFAGAVQRHKGAHLLPELARAIGQDLHVFGGGDPDLLRALRRVPNAIVHGYYRAGTLPSVLARHGIGLVVLLSIVPEAFSLTLSEAWLAGASVVAFDIGAIAERVRRDGGGRLAPLETGAAGLIEIIGQPSVSTPTTIPTPEGAARAHVALYRKWGLLR